jgi:hypothetical protein
MLLNVGPPAPTKFTAQVSVGDNGVEHIRQIARTSVHDRQVARQLLLYGWFDVAQNGLTKGHRFQGGQAVIAVDELIEEYVGSLDRFQCLASRNALYKDEIKSPAAAPQLRDSREDRRRTFCDWCTGAVDEQGTFVCGAGEGRLVIIYQNPLA